MSEEMQSCRSEEGITVGLVDSLIYISRILANRDLSSFNVQEALLQDSDFTVVTNAVKS